MLVKASQIVKRGGLAIRNMWAAFVVCRQDVSTVSELDGRQLQAFNEENPSSLSVKPLCSVRSLPAFGNMFIVWPVGMDTKHLPVS